MMRVTRIATEDGSPALRVEGRLTEQTAEELRMACEAVSIDGATIGLELSGLQFVDRAGVDLLRRLERRGARLASPTGFVRALLEEHPDERLLARLRAGDEAAFEALVREHGGRMLAVARRLVGSDDEARDVLQEAFLAAFRSIDGFAGTARLSTWLHRIVVNAALMRLRTRRRRREESIDDLLPRFDDEGRWLEAPADWDTATETLIGREETRAVVRRAIDRLPASYRTILVLRDIEDLDTDEAAAALGITPNAVKTRLHRARQALRTLLERELVKPPTVRERPGLSA